MPRMPANCVFHNFMFPLFSTAFLPTIVCPKEIAHGRHLLRANAIAIVVRLVERVRGASGVAMETNLGKMHRYESTVLVLSLFLMSLCDPTSSECTQLAPCVCSLPDGSYYNLTGLADAELVA